MKHRAHLANHHPLEIFPLKLRERLHDEVTERTRVQYQRVNRPKCPGERFNHRCNLSRVACIRLQGYRSAPFGHNSIHYRFSSVCVLKIADPDGSAVLCKQSGACRTNPASCSCDQDDPSFKQTWHCSHHVYGPHLTLTLQTT